MKQAGQEPQGFRRLAVGAAVSIWFGLILLAVGLVFSCSSQPGQSAAANGGATTTWPPNIVAAATSERGPLRAAADTPAAAMPDVATVEASAAGAVATLAESVPVVPGGATTASPGVSVDGTDTVPVLPLATALPPTATLIPPTATPAPPTATPLPTNTPTPTPTPTPVRGRPVRIVAPSIGLDASVIEVGWHVESIEGTQLAVWDVADYAAGWHKTSARPGDGGNIVISGHHNIQGEVFRYVIDLQPGADVVLYAEDREEPYVYKVEEVLLLPEKGQPLEVRRQNASYIEPTDDERVTLVTCWPYNNNTHRVVAIAKPE